MSVLTSALVACGSTSIAPSPDSDAGVDSGACHASESLVYGEPGCGSSAVGKCVSSINACAEEFCGCDGKTIIGCGVAPSPFAHTGKCVTDAGPDGDAASDADASGCPSGQILVYSSAGCGVTPTCAPPPPPCAEEYCGCDGKTITGCGVTGSPYVHKGACVDGGGGLLDAASD
jgi:hypothetical protein